MEILSYLLHFLGSPAGGITMMIILGIMIIIDVIGFRVYSASPPIQSEQLREFYRLPQTQRYLSRKRKFSIAWMVIEGATLIGIGITWFLI